MRPIIYLGPSLSHEEARTILDADYRPPVKRGDLALVPPDVKLVGIIDGVLLSDAAVGHREILSLLDRGTTVMGGGSMGALRAAELSDFGMIGVGRIYEEYASRRVEGDDEVVLAYDPFSLKPLSEPMINLRLNLAKAREKAIISVEDEAAILQELKRVFYPQRSYSKLFEIARSRLKNAKAEALKKFLESEAEDFKQNDAISLLRAVNKKMRFLQNLTNVKKI